MKKLRLASMLAVAGGLAVATAACSKGSDTTAEPAAQAVDVTDTSMAADGNGAAPCAAKPCSAKPCAAAKCGAKPCAAAKCGAKPCAAKPCAAKP